MNIIGKMRKAVNIKSGVYDDELRDDVEAARIQMMAAGVPVKVVRDDTNQLVTAAIKCYVKSNAAWEEPTIAEKQMQSYLALVNILSLTYRNKEESADAP